jgi:hypothetical protein
MKRRLLPRLLYGLLLLGAGSALAVWLVWLSNRPQHAAPAPAKARRQFADHIAQLATWFESYRNQERHYHGIQPHRLLPLAQQEACLTCHTLFPHHLDRKRRSFYNQHSHFLTCLACHLKPEERGRTALEWTDFGVVDSVTRQGAYGLERQAGGSLSGRENFISRIAPMLRAAGSATLIFTPYDDKRYRQFRADAQSGLEIDENEFREFAEKDVGPALACLDCHAADAPFPWTALGFSQARIHELTHSAAVGMVENYEAFQFPIVEE